MSWLIAAGLWGCVGVKGLATGDSEGGLQQSAALDEIARQDRSGGGLDTPGDGPGGFTGPGGAGGGMNGNNTGGSGNPGSSDPFGGVDVGGGGGNPATGSGGECQGSVCSTDSPEGQLIGYFNITVSLHPDPDTQGGNCNDLFPPPVQRKWCQPVSNLTKPGVGSYLAGLWISDAWALPRNNNIDGIESEVTCSEITYQPPIDPSKVPHVVVRSDRTLHTGKFGSTTIINDKTLSPRCQADGSWFLETEMIWVPVSPYPPPEGNNTWNIDVDAQYPKDGAWESRGTRHLVIKCGWDATVPGTISCHNQPPAPVNALPLLPVEATLKSN